jgi:putative ABC transport system permease protein
MTSLLRDLSYSVRTLLRTPVFTVLAVITIALGVGATTAIFSVVNAVLLSPLPYGEPDRLVLIWADMRARDVVDFPFSAPDLRDLRERGTVLDGAAGVNTIAGSLTGDGGEPEQVRVAAVTPDVFRVLGTGVIRGRDFADEDAAPPPPVAADGPPGVAAPPLPVMAVLSYEFWQRRYGGDDAVVGRTVQLGANTLEIIGVTQPGVELLFPAGTGVQRRPDVWVAQRINFATAQRNTHFLRVIGRLAPGASLVELQAQLDAFGADLRAEHPIKEGADMHYRAEPMRENLIADVRTALLAIMGAVLLVLLIACANVANLQLVRSAARQQELAVRSALGGTRGRLVSQMMTESGLLALAGAVLGVGLAWWGIRLLLLLEPADLPRVDAVVINGRVLAFSVALAACATLLFGLLPALRASRPDVAVVLRRSGRSTGLAGNEVLRRSVVVAQVALCFVLLVGSGLMLRTFAALQQVDPGFNPEGVITFRAPPRQGGEAARVYITAARERLAALPGVVAISATSTVPLDGVVNHGRWGLADAEQDPERFRQADLRFVLPGYFEVMGTTLLAGRDFTEAENAPTSQVVIIDEVLARTAFGDVRAAVGELILTRLAPDPEWFEVVGVAAHQRNVSLAAESRPAIHFPAARLAPAAADRWIVRTVGDPVSLLPAIRAEIAAIDPLVPVADVRTMHDYVREAMARTRFALTLIGIFAAVAAILAAVGLYGVLVTVVRQRTPEIGLRVAFGAEPGNILRLFVGEGLRLGALGIVLGAGAALLLTRLVAGMLVGVQPGDPATYAGMAALFLGIIAIASWLPASRAARLPPNTALRQ